jgi:DNA-binding NtrC family response regulator
MRALSAAGWFVIGAEDGNEGIQHLKNAEQSVDLVLLDQLMPGMSGADTLAAIRTLSPSIPVIIMTGFVTEESALELKKQGAFDCLAKPFTPEQLRNVARRAVEKRL